MRLRADMSEEEILQSLTRASLDTWGAERVAAQGKALDHAAKAIRTVLRTPLAPLSEEPELSGPAYEPAREA